MEEKISPGKHALYVNGMLRVPVFVLKNVEGWWEVLLSDGSKAIIRPSRIEQSNGEYKSYRENFRKFQAVKDLEKEIMVG